MMLTLLLMLYLTFWINQYTQTSSSLQNHFKVGLSSLVILLFYVWKLESKSSNKSILFSPMIWFRWSTHTQMKFAFKILDSALVYLADWLLPPNVFLLSTLNRLVRGHTSLQHSFWLARMSLCPCVRLSLSLSLSFFDIFQISFCRALFVYYYPSIYELSLILFISL